MTHQKMHEHEVEIDAALVNRLVADQFPQWSKLSLQRILSAGTDNALFRLGDDKCVRLAKIPNFTAQVNMQHRFLPMLSNRLSLAIPTLLGQGEPSAQYPGRWSVLKWLSGRNAVVSEITDLNQAAEGLARFLLSLWKIHPADLPKSNRGEPLKYKDEETRQAISCLHGVIDTNAATRIWRKCVAASEYSKEPVWIHGDLLPTNLLVRAGRIVGVIDFDLMGAGDPACDLIAAWALFDKDSRRVFRHALGVDESTWLRGCGWALSIALIILPYYRDTNPVLTKIAHRMLNQILFV